MIVLASWATHAALENLPSSLPRAGEVGIDTRVLLFTAAVSLFAGVLFGLAPAFRFPERTCRTTSRKGAVARAGAHGAHGVLVVVEMALALVLLIGAGLMLRSLVRLWDVDTGFNPRNVVTFGLSLPPSMGKTSPAAIRAAFRAVDAKLASTPGIQAASMNWGAFPFSGDDEWLFWPEGQPKPMNRSEMKWTLEYVVDPDYLKVMETPLRSGRFFTTQDDEHSARVVLVDEVFARSIFRMKIPSANDFSSTALEGKQQAEIIGVVAHVKQWGLDSDDTELLRGAALFPFHAAAGFRDGARAIRYASRGTFPGSGAGAFDSIRRSVQQAERPEGDLRRSDDGRNHLLFNREAPVFHDSARLLRRAGAPSFQHWNLRGHLLSRRSANARNRDPNGPGRTAGRRVSSVLGDGVKMALFGVAIGLAAAFGLTRLMAGLFYGISASDPLTFVAVAILLMLVALAACYVPARRAMRVDPMVALRYE